MKKTYLLPVLFALIITSVCAQKKETNEKSSRNETLENYGKALLESIKSSDAKKILVLSLTITEFKNTVQTKTAEEFKNKFVAEVAKEKDETFNKMTKGNFAKIKENTKINWQKVKYVGFNFERQKNRSDNLGFDWGKGLLLFEADGQQYEINISEMSQLLGGWKGMGFRLSEKASENKEDDYIEHAKKLVEIEIYGKDLLESFNASNSENLLKLSMKGNELVNTVKKNTKNEELRTRLIAEMHDEDGERSRGLTKMQFDRIKNNNTINWQNAEFVDIIFEKDEKTTKDFNFDWGSAVLYFKTNGKQYKLNIGELALLITGWKGNNYRLEE